MVALVAADANGQNYWPTFHQFFYSVLFIPSGGASYIHNLFFLKIE